MKFQDNTRATKTFNKPQFMSFSYGQHRVRLLGDPELKFIHYFHGRGSIECPGNDCPICERNREIRAENPDDYSDHPNYKSWSERHYVNALDRTEVVTCPECGHAMKADAKGRYPSKCEECDTFVGEVTPAPLDKVRIVNLSKTNKELLQLLNDSTLDENKERIGLENMDVIFMVAKAGNRKNISVSVDKDATDVVEVPEDALYDLDNVTIKLSYDETLEFMNGVSFRDIFAARKANKDADAEVEINEETKKNVEELFDSLTN